MTASPCVRTLKRLALATILFHVARLGAEPVPVDNVVAAARGWLAVTDQKPLDEDVGNGVKWLAPGMDEHGTVLYYAVYPENGGLVVMAPDDAIEPVIAFAPEARAFDDPSPCNHLRLMLEDDLKDRLAAVKAGTVKGASVKAAKWALLIAAAKDAQGVKAGLGSVSDLRVAPLTYTKWSQTYVYQGGAKAALYNYYTPPYGAGQMRNDPCGCTATALAQLMRYHQYPLTGVGVRTCSIRRNGVPATRNTRGGDGAGGPYDWAAMPADPGGLAQAGRLTTAQRMAVGALCHDAGVASQMNYSPDESSASITWARNDHPLQTVFHYASADSAAVAVNATFSKSDINRALNPSLDAGLPGGLGIWDSAGGHVLVVDGYGYAYGSLYHHLNLGWGGVETAWYNLPHVNTHVANYFLVNALLFNVHPTKGNIGIISGRCLDTDGKALAGVKVTARHVSGVNPNRSDYSNAKGIYAILVQPGTYNLTGTKSGFSFQPSVKQVTAGSGALRNSWLKNFRAVTRIMRLSTRKLAFGMVPAYSTNVLHVKVFNDGAALMTVSGIACPAGFTVEPASFTVPGNGGFKKLNVFFKPAPAEPYDGVLILRSDRSSGPNTVAVSGRGMNLAPSFVAGFPNRMASVGQTLSLSGLAVGAPSPRYTWQCNGSPIAGATGPVYSIEAVQPGQAGVYAVQATNVAGCVSTACTVTVVTPPSGMALIPPGVNNGRDPDGVYYGSTNAYPFFMDKTEVTLALWDEVRNWGLTNGYADLPVGTNGGPQHPVCDVSWFTVVKWCNARSQKEGETPAYYTSPNCDNAAILRTGPTNIALWVRLDRGYRLPDVQEWIFAARGGTEGLRFPWGNTISHSNANYYSDPHYYYDVSPTRGFHPAYSVGGQADTAPAGSFDPNGYGLFDMIGNVHELTALVERGGFYISDLLGGSCFRPAPYCLLYTREYDVVNPNYSTPFVGFRTVLGAIRP